VPLEPEQLLRWQPAVFHAGPWDEADRAGREGLRPAYTAQQARYGGPGANRLENGAVIGIGFMFWLWLAEALLMLDAAQSSPEFCYPFAALFSYLAGFELAIAWRRRTT
jgi:hypothetical protein